MLSTTTFQPYRLDSECAVLRESVDGPVQETARSVLGIRSRTGLVLKSDSACMLNIRQHPIIAPSSSLAGASRVIVHRLASLFTTAFGNKHIVAVEAVFAC